MELSQKAETQRGEPRSIGSEATLRTPAASGARQPPGPRSPGTTKGPGVTSRKPAASGTAAGDAGGSD